MVLRLLNGLKLKIHDELHLFCNNGSEFAELLISYISAETRIFKDN